VVKYLLVQPEGPTSISNLLIPRPLEICSRDATVLPCELEVNSAELKSEFNHSHHENISSCDVSDNCCHDELNDVAVEKSKVNDVADELKSCAGDSVIPTRTSPLPLKADALLGSRVSLEEVTIRDDACHRRDRTKLSRSRRLTRVRSINREMELLVMNPFTCLRPRTAVRTRLRVKRSALDTNDKRCSKVR
jgi:hypothetical protein